MKIVAALSSPEQDDVIRAILESKGQWNPPWDRRAPPPEERHGSDPPESAVEVDVDPDLLWSED